MARFHWARREDVQRMRTSTGRPPVVLSESHSPRVQRDALTGPPGSASAMRLTRYARRQGRRRLPESFGSKRCCPAHTSKAADQFPAPWPLQGHWPSLPPRRLPPTFQSAPARTSVMPLRRHRLMSGLLAGKSSAMLTLKPGFLVVGSSRMQAPQGLDRGGEMVMKSSSRIGRGALEK